VTVVALVGVARVVWSFFEPDSPTQPDTSLTVMQPVAPDATTPPPAPDGALTVVPPAASDATTPSPAPDAQHIARPVVLKPMPEPNHAGRSSAAAVAPAPIEPALAAPPPRGPGRCERTTCALSSAAALALHDRVCLTAPGLTVQPTCAITRPDATAICVRRDAFATEPLTEVTWSRCP
jgi:hypothetical protein